MRQIIPGVYAHSRGSIYQYFIIEGAEITLIDSGLRLFSQSLLHNLDSLSRNAQLKRILITHADGDHYGAVRMLKTTFDCQIVSSELEAEAMKRGGMSRELKPRTSLDRLIFALALPTFTAPAIEVDKIIHPGDVLPILGGLQILDSAGHTPGHLSFYQPDLRLLFAGDSIIKRKGIPSPASGPNCWNETLAQAAFDRQIALQPHHICGGHSYFNFTGSVV